MISIIALGLDAGTAQLQPRNRLWTDKLNASQDKSSDLAAGGLVYISIELVLHGDGPTQPIGADESHVCGSRLSPSPV